MNNLFVVYSIPEHCGHEVIDRVFTSLEEARKYVYPINERYSKNFSYWDGSPYALMIKTKSIKQGMIKDWDGCDEHEYDCNCIGNSPRKTREAYEAYWTPERTNHVHNHFHKSIFISMCKFCVDSTDNYNSLRWKTKVTEGSLT